MRILIVDDEEAIRYSLEELLNGSGDEVRASEHAPAALAALEERAADLVIADLRMPRMDGLELLDEIRVRHPETLYVLMTAYGDERTAVKALKLGAYDYIPKPFDNDEIRATVERAREVLALRTENARLRQELVGEFQGLIGDSPAMKDVYRVMHKVGLTDATVLITGESGTGKELVARGLHAESKRSARPFIAVNCSALPADLVESELFGHVRGAFTGADRDRAGVFEAAGGGTLFLDEVGDLASPAQAKLLRVLEGGEVTRLGSTQTAQVDVRLVAATNRSLEELDGADYLRDDLLYRLRVVTIVLPPLRERREDIPALATHFVARFAGEHHRPVKSISEQARRALIAYAWPGNVRELRNALERAVVLSESDVLEIGDLPAHVAGSTGSIRAADAALAGLPFTEARSRTIEAFERAYLSAALEQHGGNVSATARALGLHRQSLQKMLRRLGLQAESAS